MSQPTPETRMMNALDKARTDLGEPLTIHERRLITDAWFNSQERRPVSPVISILHITPVLTIFEALAHFTKDLDTPFSQALLNALEQAVATIPKETP